MATPKQEKLVKILKDNLINPNKTKSLEKCLLEAGYSEYQAKSARQIIEGEGVQEGLSDVVSELEKKREFALNALTAEKIEKEKAKDITDIIDKLTKNIQLLGGKPTDITKNDLSELSDEQLEKIARSSSRTSEERVSEKTS
jgi:nitrogen regulatory protein PII